MVKQLSIHTSGRGLHDVTAQVAALVRQAGVDDGLCTLFIRHTSASLIIQENADPTAKHDLERWLNDMPAHIRAALTATSLAIPIVHGKLGLGTWQGIYLCEHRRRGGERELLVHVAA